jgi:hypothetical protein
MEASPPTGPMSTAISAKDVDLRTLDARHARCAERVNARADGPRGRGRAGGRRGAYPRPLAAETIPLRITAECLDTRDIAAENVVVEHITGTGSRQLRRRSKLSATDGTIVELDTENVHVSGTASVSLLTRDALESPR